MKIGPARKFLLAVLAVITVITAVIGFGNRYLASRWIQPPGSAFDDAATGRPGSENFPGTTAPDPAAKPDSPPDALSSKQGSSPVYSPLLWEESRGFMEARTANGTPVRLAAFRITFPDAAPGELHNINLAAERLAGTVIGPGQLLSLNGTLGPYTAERGFQEGFAYRGQQVCTVTGGGMCKVATAIFNTAVLADLKIVERHTHAMPVDYVPPGQDATVWYGSLDLKIRNNNADPVLLWADLFGKTIYMAFYGSDKPPRTTWHHEVIERYPFPVIVHPNSSLHPGENKIIIAGAEGLTVRSWVTVHHPGGAVEIKESRTIFYAPLPRVIEQGGS